MPEGAALIWCPFADEDTAAGVARQLLDERLIACANLIPAMRSLYLRQGESGDERECAALFKTDAALLDRAVARIAGLHPYYKNDYNGDSFVLRSIRPCSRCWIMH